MEDGSDLSFAFSYWDTARCSRLQRRRDGMGRKVGFDGLGKPQKMYSQVTTEIEVDSIIVRQTVVTRGLPFMED